jgi:cytoskeleton protein RodZ
MVEADTPEAALFPERVGDRLRAARVKAGLDLSDVATRTRIPQRHLVAIEAGDYAALPALTYCVGFVKSYARAVGADDVELGRAVRAELGYSPDKGVDHADYDAADPARVPPRTLALTALAVVALIAAGYGVWRSGTFDGAGTTSDTETAATAGNTTAAAPAKPAVPTTGQVVLTATDQVWLQVDDDNQKALIAREMKAGETFIVPATSVNPRLKTSRAEKLKITVGGVAVPTVGPPETLVKNISLTAAALSGRSADPGAVPNGATSATPANASAPAVDANGVPIPRGLGAPAAPGLSDQN